MDKYEYQARRKCMMINGWRDCGECKGLYWSKCKYWKRYNVKYKAIKKTIIYRILGITSSILIGYGIFGTWEGATLATITIEAVHTFMYYILEKIYK